MGCKMNSKQWNFVIVVEMIKEAWISIISYKLRSSLTVLGVVIGVTSVTLMVSIGQGVQRKVDKQFSSLGSNLLTIRPGSPKVRGISSGNFQTLTYEDAQAIAHFNFVKNVAYSNSVAAQAVYGNVNKSVTVYGVSSQYFDVNNLNIGKGQLLKLREDRSISSYVVLGKNVADELYKNDDPVGKIIRVKGVALKIIGVLQEKGSGFGPSEDDAVFVSFATFLQRISGSKYPKAVSHISINISDQNYMDYAQDKITQLLRKRHFIKAKLDDDFRIDNLKEISDSIKNVTSTFTTLLAAIAAISLVVGSIGIVNMMLVSVTERTREIGLRKALGAQENLIMQQFLIESLIISFIGSMIGLILGLVFSQIAAVVLAMELPVSVYSIIISIIISIIVGILSGLIPSIKAAKLSPVEAFRVE